jgi:murein L,D-transpeptidase YafK
MIGLLFLSGHDYLQLGQMVPTMTASNAQAIVVDTASRKLTLLRNDDALKTYDVALGHTPSPKQREGDGRTPEGRYVIDSKIPRSRSDLDCARLTRNRSIARGRCGGGGHPGRDIMIDELHNGLRWLGRVHRAIDWPDGCSAVTNSQIEESWSLVEVGTPIEITS